MMKFLAWLALVFVAAFTATMTCDDEFSFRFMVVFLLFLIAWTVTAKGRRL